MSKRKTICVFIGSVIILATIFYPWLITKCTGLNYPDKIGEFGDMYGVLNPIISALAFGAFILSLFMQQEELRLLRKEMKNALKESKKQTKQFMAQVKISTDAQIKDEIYRMLSIAMQSSDNTTYAFEKSATFVNESAHITYTGNRAIRKMQINLLNILPKTENIEELSRFFIERKGYLLDRYENMANWINAILNIIQYINLHLNKKEAATPYANRVMSSFSNPHKFFLYLYAGAEDKEKGRQFREFAIANKLIDKRILLPFMLKPDIMEKLDDALFMASTFNNPDQVNQTK